MLYNDEEKSVNQKIDEAHNRLLMIDQQYYRIQNLHKAEEISIAELQNIKSTLETLVKNLTSRVESLKEEEATLVKQKENFQESIGKAREIFIGQNKEIETAKADHDLRKATLEAAEVALEVRERSVADRETKALSRESDLKDKHSRIKAFAENL